MNIKVIKAGKEFVFQGKTNLSLLEQLREQKLYIDAACGGKGTCGKCRVQMLNGVTEPTRIEHQFLNEKELEAGFRLACKTFPKADCTVVVEAFAETEFRAVAEHSTGKIGYLPENISMQSGVEELYVIAIDLGTTTIAMELAEAKSGQVIHTVTDMNRQRSYGADVISRIQAANAGKGKELQKSICTDLYYGIKRLLRECKLSPQKIKKIGISGNTTMGHLLMGYSCEKLGRYPFETVNIKTITREFQEFFGEQQEEDTEALYMDAKVILLPGISAYVGADIVAGILASGMEQREKPCMLIDLGTNGEMVIGNKEKLFVTSVAAGPAFEGGDISCGMGSVPGAICKVSLEQNTVQLQTIGNKEPLGLCGTGVVETVCELWKEKLVDETGVMVEEIQDTGFLLGKTPDGKEILFTQTDVQEFLLAKSAVRAGIECLLKRFGTTSEEIEEVFLAGGFGYHMDIEKMIAIGMLPKGFIEKVTIVGNSSLGGTITYLTQEDAVGRCKEIVEKTEELQLTLAADFIEFYIEYMTFKGE